MVQIHILKSTATGRPLSPSSLLTKFGLTTTFGKYFNLKLTYCSQCPQCSMRFFCFFARHSKTAKVNSNLHISQSPHTHCKAKAVTPGNKRKRHLLIFYNERSKQRSSSTQQWHPVQLRAPNLGNALNQSQLSDRGSKVDLSL